MIVDKKSPEYRKLLEGLKIPQISVGVDPDKENEIHPDSKLTIQQIAIIHEYGSGHIPQRSFLRAWFDENQNKLAEVLSAALLRVVEGADATAESDKVALWVQGQIQKRIANGIPPPNAPSTILKKGSSTPLIDTGVLRSSIKGYVVK